MARVVVFLDYQNLYSNAREAFAHGAVATGRVEDPDQPPSSFGHVQPWKLAKLLEEKLSGREGLCTGQPNIAEVRIYRGEPDGAEQETSHAAFQRQRQVWIKAAGAVKIISRPLRYPRAWDQESRSWVWTGDKPHEKGVDVALAIDVVRMAHQDEYDHAIVFSSDGDISPAVEHVLRQRMLDGSRPSVTVASWDGKNGMRMKPGLPRVFCHYVNLEDFLDVCDQREYTRPAGIANLGPDGTPRPGPSRR